MASSSCESERSFPFFQCFFAYLSIIFIHADAFISRITACVLKPPIESSKSVINVFAVPNILFPFIVAP